MTTDLNKVVISQFKDHNHEPKSDAEIIFKAALPDLHEKAVANRRESTKSLCLREVDRLIKDHQMCMTPSVAKATNTIYNHARSLDYWRKKDTPTLAKTIEKIVCLFLLFLIILLLKKLFLNAPSLLD